MSVGIQHFLVLLAVAACLSVVARQGFRTLTLRGRGKLGACCAKGCDAAEKLEQAKKPRVHFVPVEDLGRRR